MRMAYRYTILREKTKRKLAWPTPSRTDAVPDHRQGLSTRRIRTGHALDVHRVPLAAEQLPPRVIGKDAVFPSLLGDDGHP